MPRPPSMIVVRGEEQSTSAELHAPARRMLVEYEAPPAGKVWDRLATIAR